VCDVSEAQATTDLTSFFTAVGGEIHTLAPGSKVESGFLGTGTCGLENGDYQTVGASPGLDILTYHDYYAATTPVGGDQSNGIAVRVAQAKALGKPIIAGEMGIEAGTACSVTLAQRAADYSAKISAQSALGVAGFMLWDWYPGSTSSCVYENIQAGDPSLAGPACWIDRVSATCVTSPWPSGGGVLVNGVSFLVPNNSPCAQLLRHAWKFCPGRERPKHSPDLNGSAQRSRPIRPVRQLLGQLFEGSVFLSSPSPNPHAAFNVSP
jgi:hypothetical protein